MIGLKRHTVEVVEHDSAWLDYGTSRCGQIAEGCELSNREVQHVGSTSIPGLFAKPIIDIVVGVRSFFHFDTLREKLERLGYIYRGLREGSGGHLFILESSPDIRIEHLHVVILDSTHWDDYITFRGLLRKDHLLRGNYNSLKCDLQECFANNRVSYTEGKHDFISNALASRNAQQYDDDQTPTAVDQ